MILPFIVLGIAVVLIAGFIPSDFVTMEKGFIEYLREHAPQGAERRS